MGVSSAEKCRSRAVKMGSTKLATKLATKKIHTQIPEAPLFSDPSRESLFSTKISRGGCRAPRSQGRCLPHSRTPIQGAVTTVPPACFPGCAVESSVRISKREPPKRRHGKNLEIVQKSAISPRKPRERAFGGAWHGHCYPGWQSQKPQDTGFVIK